MLTPDSTETKARELFNSGYFCAESVLMAIAEQTGMDSSLIPRIATGFCGGMSRTSGMCGALTGGVMALGLVFGRDFPQESRDTTYKLVQRFQEAFVKEFGAINCTDLLGCDLSTPQGASQFAEQGLLKSVCLEITGRAAAIAAELISNQKAGEKAA